MSLIEADKQELLHIPGIHPDKVDLYGARFLILIRNAERRYQEMKGLEDLVPDPNHDTVINISSDEDGDDDFVDNSYSPDSPVERSTYFETDPRVEAFRAQSRSAIYSFSPY
jgi:bloom syndrome protein